ncbi:hypothetical protein CXF83_21820 [Shewanella sp. Choline-02u-19]|uniref:hypothetical protein n=1 Tax=unclassified Shewanella TaxID=196818 RepID=UPI000C3389DF|nr:MULTISPECIES: hypothetical protein [unclassified Shewanella]PKH59333.1 hypothetical protein CXF84_03540 [Shewanella sp. Bg11-22]PKI29156.1 hypothetical protein CXF83_21820 [Shewanella sp. Choline-02u-19]
MFKELYTALSGLADQSVMATRIVKKLADIEKKGHTADELTVAEMAEIRARFTQYLDNDIEALHKLNAIKERLVVDGDSDIKADIDWLLRGMTFKQMNYEHKNGLINSVLINRSAKGASIKDKKYTIKDFMGSDK